MELFVMNRFDPSAIASDGTGDAAAEKEARVLAKLNARKNKRIRVEPDSECVTLAENSTETEIKGKEELTKSEDLVVEKPRKKKKKVKNVETNITSAQLNEPEPEQIEKNEEKNEEENVKQEIEHTNENEESEPQELPGAGFTILDEVESKKLVKIARILPNWLAKPSIISCDLSLNALPTKDMTGLHKFIQDALRRNKIKKFFPVQQQVIPFLLQNNNLLCRPNDICVSAPTGSGKTLAFVLPTIQILSRETVRQLRCLVVLPVHDLAVQIYRVYSNYCSGTKLKVVLISGQTSFGEEQKLLVRKGCYDNYLSQADIVVCTPGRLVDHLQRTPGFSLKYLRFLIIDEADRIMDEAPNDWLYHFEKAVDSRSEPLVAAQLSRPCNRSHVQKLLFSATLSQDPEKLTRLGLFQPRLFTSVVSSAGSMDILDASNETGHFVGKYTTPAELTEHSVISSPSLKPLVVHHLMQKFKYCRALCFTGSLAATHRLYLLMRHFGGIRVAECSSEIDRKTRDELLKQFSSGKIDLLVCTDAVARGMDLGVVDCVISYDPPKFVKNYIHRIGRTARAGRPGTAITILAESEKRRFEKLLEHAEKKTVMPLELAPEELQVYEETFRSALESLKKEVRDETQSKAVKSVRKRHQNSRKRHIPNNKSAFGKNPRVSKARKVGKLST